MTDYFVSSSGSNTSPYDTWAKAATSLQTAITAASTDGDRVILDYVNIPSGDKEVSANVTYTFAANIELICSLNSGTSTVTPTAMGTGGWVGNSSSVRYVYLAGAYNVRVYGLTMRIAGSTATAINPAYQDGIHVELEECYFWCGNTNTGSRITLGIYGSNNYNTYIKTLNCTFRFANASQGINDAGKVDIIGGSVSSAGTAPTVLFLNSSANPSGHATTRVVGMDLTHLSSKTIVGDNTINASSYEFYGCKMPSSFTWLATQTVTGRAGSEVWAFDCSSDDTHYNFYHENKLGYTIAVGSGETGAINRNSEGAKWDGTNKLAWKIVGSASASYRTPYRSPWIEVYQASASGITPYIEILRDGSTTAYKDDEVWAEWLAKTTSSYSVVTWLSDRRVLAGSAADQAAGSGLGDWSGEAASAWSGKIDTGSSISPAELGQLAGCVCVGGNFTVWVDPTIRGRA